MAPQRIHFIDEGRFAPFVYGAQTKLDIESFEQITVTDYETKYPIRLFVRGEPYTMWGFIESDRHLFGAEGGVVNLLGTEQQGRDMLIAHRAGQPGFPYHWPGWRRS